MTEDLLTARTIRLRSTGSVKQEGRPDATMHGASVSRREILLVDGSRTSRQELRELLQPLSHEIYEAGSGKEAFRLLSVRPVDLVLADLSTPGIDGTTFCNALRSYFRGRALPVAFITEPRHAALEASAIAAGADDFLVRPLIAGPLLARVEAILRRTPITGPEEDFASVLLSLAQAVEARDPATGSHCQRVSLLCSTLGAAMGLGAEELVTLQRGAFLHDIGKIAIPDQILFKRGPLSPDEWIVMQNHTTCGERICSGTKSLSDVLPIIRSHHERWDGSGYPDRLRNDEIPLLARIIQAADIYDALTTERPYKAAYSPERALETLRAEAAAGWRDPRVVEAFADVFPLIQTVDAHSSTSLLALSLALSETGCAAAIEPQIALP